MLLAVKELARQYNRTLRENLRAQVKLDSLPLEPAGVIYRRAGRIYAIRRVDHVLRTQAFATKSDQPDALLGLHTLEPWQFELLDAMMTRYQRKWKEFYKQYHDQARLALRNNRILQSFVTESATVASQQPGLSATDAQRLRELASDPGTRGDKLVLVFERWGLAWLCTNHYAVQWEHWE